MVGYTTNTDGQEVGFVAMASIDVPECPEFTGSMKMTRMRMKRTLIINPSIESKGTSELFVMGATETNESSITENAQYRMNMAVLNDISLVIDSRNIAKQTLTPPRNWIPDKSCQSCSICCRNFNFMYRRRHHCRLCGDVICKTCYVTRGVLDSEADRPVDVCQRKFCVRCVMGLRVMDKRLDKFSRRFSKLLPHNKEPSNFSASTPEHQLSTGNMLGSFTTYFKRGSNQKHRINLSQLYKLSATQETSPEIDENQSGGTCARAFVGGFLVSYDCGSSKCCQSSPSLNLLHSNSYGKLRHLSRHGSTASLVSNSDSIEETLIPKMDEVTRMVII
ncbi:Predicted Rho/Rac guanine nucleotide exchange factor/faciogenital dysplasia protein 3 [Plasmopara halstedii]|uniref:Predicted Rho/Rac guanine nucleotide exchange factor/faciogenital dysplasia protein 3 n=1 Tax=Plasmopara halstedii TaxID=4781 RepID=A0A0P1AF48_PLAHL|nr:Predicted Rho/Rac guanine nucleotide exchange factor/faciogenital dysplasia protein 3 [Plasmopara halstedii]CEG39216.1 Predicted Rho/Rac guanine nucleotide exchange factor/faciogenital dysplasia protein 3 [Plasmopara halstedii]|eukprot:XP_024575585.1 Predicted Rho/Rac guanine nucleotide exchange factor/faciogenital dysplasia protein 3 [Plasmopara halstedii]